MLAFHHLVDLPLQSGDGGLQPLLLARHVVGEQLLRRDGGLVQHRLAEGEAVGQPDPAHALGPVWRDLDPAQLRIAEQVALRHHLGQDHGDDLQVLDLVLGVDPLGAVLDHQHPDRPSAAQQRHPEEGVIGVLAGLRPVGEGRVGRRVRQGQRPPRAHDFADQALAWLQPGDVHRLRIKTLGGEQLQVRRGPPQVDRADLGHHFAGDDPHDHVELGLGRLRAGHAFADLPEQAARCAYAGRQGHGRCGLLTGAF